MSKIQSEILILGFFPFCLVTFLFCQLFYANLYSISKIEFPDFSPIKFQTKRAISSICTVFKKEREYIEEWLDYHFSLGIDKIVMFDNNEDDFDDEVLERIKKNYQNVVLIDKRNQPYYQAQFFTSYYKNISRNEWVLFIDIDEFLTFNNSKINIHSLINDAIQNNCGQVLINWLHFGNNGHLKRTNGTVIERFPIPIQPLDFKRKGLGHSENCVYKTFVRGGADGKMEPHFFDNKKIKTCDTTFRKIPLKLFEKPLLSYAYLRHYCTKSEEEYINFKRAKRVPGKPDDYMAPGAAAIHASWSYYNSFNEYYPNVPHRGI